MGTRMLSNLNFDISPRKTLVFPCAPESLYQARQIILKQLDIDRARDCHYPYRPLSLFFLTHEKGSVMELAIIFFVSLFTLAFMGMVFGQ